MIIFIISVIAILYIVLVMYMYNSLKGMPMSKAIMCIIISVFVMFLITLLLFGNIYTGIDTSGKEQAFKNTKMIIVNIFTPVNGLIILPYLCKNIIKYYEKKIDKETLIKKMIIRLGIFIIFVIFEKAYVKGATIQMIQQNIKS